MKNKIIEKVGSVRVDLLGGTLDFPPLDLVLKNSITLNLATTLKAKVTLKPNTTSLIEIYSKDYNSHYVYSSSDFSDQNLSSDFFGPMKFVAHILSSFNIADGLIIEMESGSPAGAGLGGSSAMGITLYHALAEYSEMIFDREQAITIIRNIESQILDAGPAGYQDYYPACYGGVLALTPGVLAVSVEQLYSKDLKQFIESHFSLIFSGETRCSGINNWEVYKLFFNHDQAVRSGLQTIADLSYKAYQSIKSADYDQLIDLVTAEGGVRENLFSGILSPAMRSFKEKLLENIPDAAMKVCGAGGGGCFLVGHKKKDDRILIEKLVLEMGMKTLDLNVSPPLE